MPQFNTSGDGDSESNSITFEVKSKEDGLQGFLQGQYQVLVRIIDDSQITIPEGNTTIIQAEVSTPIYDTEGNLEWLFIESVSEYFDDDATREINTYDLSTDSQFNKQTGDTVHREPPSQSQNQESSRDNNCSRCQKVVAADQLENGLCIYCRNQDTGSTQDGYDPDY